MRKIFLLAAVVLIFQSAGYAQLKPKHFWPATTAFSIKKYHLNYRASEGDIRTQFFLNDCIEGDCKNGDGVFAVTNARNVEFRENGSLDLTINLYKGKFSEDGKNFNGKMLEYNYRLSGSGAKDHWFYANKFTPFATVNLAEDIAKPMLAGNYIFAEGEAVRTEEKWGDKIKYSYQLHGTGASRQAMTELSAASMQGRYENGQLLMLQADMKENFPAKRFTGKMTFKQKPLAGRLEFRDGSYYEGFFYNNHYNGPGKLVSNDGSVHQGFWENGVLKDSLAVSLPPSLWDYSAQTISEARPCTITIGDKTYKGNYSGDWKDGKPHGKGFFSADQNTLFYGSFENGNANGLGYFYSLYKTETWACCLRQAEYVQSGLFTNNWLTYGNKNIFNYMWYTSSSDPNYIKGYIPQDSYLFSGTFNNKGLDGCGKSVLTRYNIEPELSCTMTGNFKDGGLHGWATVDFPYKKPDDKWKGKYFGYFIYHPVSPYAIKQDLLAGMPYNPSGDVVKRYTDYEKEVELFLKEIAVGQDDCSGGLISEADKKKYTEDAKNNALYARKMATNYKNQPPPITLVSNYDNVVKQIKYKAGTTLRKKQDDYLISVITGYNFTTQRYSVTNAIYQTISRKDGTFKALKEASKTVSLTEQEIEKIYNVQSQLYSICSVCNGRGYTTGTVHGGHEGGWEKWTDNVFYNRPSTAYSYEVTTGCSACRTVGWR